LKPATGSVLASSDVVERRLQGRQCGKASDRPEDRDRTRISDGTKHQTGATSVLEHDIEGPRREWIEDGAADIKTRRPYGNTETRSTSRGLQAGAPEGG
jgi:hypothetical protein